MAQSEKEYQQEVTTSKRDTMNALASKIDAQLVKNINVTLEMSKPDELIALLETFVALLRNKERANHVDVNLYF